MAPYSKSPTQQRLNNLITQTRTIIKQIKKEHSRNNKLFLILDFKLSRTIPISNSSPNYFQRKSLSFQTLRIC